MSKQGEKELYNRLFEFVKEIKIFHRNFLLWYGLSSPDNSINYIAIESNNSPIGVWVFKNTKKEDAIKQVEDAIANYDLKVLIDNIVKDKDVIL